MFPVPRSRGVAKGGGVMSEPFRWEGNGWYLRLFAGVPEEIHVQRLPSADRWGFELVGCWLTPNNEWVSETFTMDGRYVTRATPPTEDLIGGRIRE